MNKREVFIKVKNLDNMSYVEKYFHCDACPYAAMENCPIVKRIVRDVTQTTYSIDNAKLNITASTYDHDFWRALNAVRRAVDARCNHER